MIRLEVYDPPMCCSTGVCGPNIDPVLPRFAGDLKWLAEQNVTVERFNLSQQPQAFVNNETVKTTLEQEGNACLPLILVNGQIVSRGSYPSRDDLLRFTSQFSTQEKSTYTEAVAELVAIGAAIASNCEPCFKYHFDKARRLGVSADDMAKAVKTAQSVKEAPAKKVLSLAERMLKQNIQANPLPIAPPCCPDSKEGCS
jgi:AhpD family alkylhydroperoxidase